MISIHTVQLEDDFDISKAMEEYETMEAKIEKCITESLFWKMLYKAISQGSEKGHILYDVGPDFTPSYVKGVGFLSLKKNGFCTPFTKKGHIRLSIGIVGFDSSSDSDSRRSHIIDVPFKLFDKKVTKKQIASWIASQWKLVNKFGEKNAKKEIDRLIKDYPKLVEYIIARNKQ